MGEDLEKLKQRLPLLEYLRQQHWAARPTGYGDEFVGSVRCTPDPAFLLCQARKNLFYCHGCGQGGDLIRFVEYIPTLVLSPKPHLSRTAQGCGGGGRRAEETAAFYHRQWPHYPEALRYLQQRGVHDAALLQALHMGYAPGRNLRVISSRKAVPSICCGASVSLNAQATTPLPASGFSLLPGRMGCQPLRRSLDAGFPHRFLPGSKGGLFAGKRFAGSPA